MIELIFLILFPTIVAFLLLAIPGGGVRDAVVKLAALVIGAGSVYLLVRYFSAGLVIFSTPFEPATEVMFVIELVIAVFFLYLGIRHKKFLAVVLVLFQTALLLIIELGLLSGAHPESNLFIDQFSLIMAMIIGIIGTLISVYALGYMETYHSRHPEVKDRRRVFFFMVFVFLAAMFGLVFSNNLLWVFFFWEITTLCSFILIGYAGNDEATNNAFLALVMNLLGGIAFAGALIYLLSTDPTGGLLEIETLLASGHAIALIPAVMLGFAGITKAALMPFSSWLVGAMVAPTPVSALLHSSTMVKAGVYIIVRFAPVLTGTLEGMIIGLIGGFTFLLASAIAISQSNAKKVLAYSTIANLGLIVACAGVGTYKLVWAAILLIIFHAIAKSLLFLCVGTVEHRIGSRNIEDMSGLIIRMPKLTVMMIVGIAGMFLAPFGMLISKWAAIEAFIEAQFGLIFVAILAFGGSITVFFWSKWMGKLLSFDPHAVGEEKSVRAEKWFVLSLLTGLTILVCLIFPFISSTLIEPFVLAVYGQTTRLAQDNLVIMAMMLFLLMIMPFSMLISGKNGKKVTVYMGGRPTSPDLKFMGSMGITRDVTLTNYYFTNMFGEKRLLMAGTALCLGLVLLAIIILAGMVL
jgi:ech hydrogenase subunit A